jgi:hypothetical protein
LASAEIKIPGLIPGRRYRMVIETANSAGNITVGTTSVPSIEFVVPSANQLISTYVPTYRVLVNNFPSPPQTIIGYNPGASTPVEDTVTTVQTAKSKTCNNSPILSGGGNYLFRFSSLAGVPPVGTVFSVSGVASKPGTSHYYNNLLYTVQSHTSNDNIVAVGRLNGEGGWSGQTDTTKRRWRDQAGKPFPDINTTAAGGNPTLRWSEPVTVRTQNPPSVGQPQPIYSELIPAYSITNVTVSLPASINLENNISIDGTRRVVEMPVFFYIQNGIFYNLDNTAMSGLPPTITGVPSAIPRTGTNSNRDLAAGTLALRSYRFTTARYTLEGGLWSAAWSQFDDRYISEPLMRNVIYSGQAIL